MGITRIKLQKGLHLVKRGEVWYAEKFAGGRWEYRKSLQTGDLETAKRRLIEEAVSSEPILRNRPAKVAALSLDRAFETYEEWYEKRRKESSQEVTFPVIRSFIKRLGGDTDTRDITQKHLQDYIDSREGCSFWTVKNDFGRVRAFLKWIDKKNAGAIDLHCVRGIELPKDNSVTPEAPSMETVKAILRRVKGHPTLEDLCTVLFETGMRPGEVLALRGVDVNGNLVKIQKRDSDGWSPKSKWSIRTIQVPETVAAILKARKERLFDKAGYVFGLESGKMRHEKYVSAMFRDALRGGKKGKVEMPAEFRGVNLYGLKHAFCSIHAAAVIDGKPNPAYMPLQQLSAYVGHGPGSTHLLERHYADRNAMRAGAPVALLGTSVETTVTAIGVKS